MTREEAIQALVLARQALEALEYGQGVVLCKEALNWLYSGGATVGSSPTLKEIHRQGVGIRQWALRGVRMSGSVGLRTRLFVSEVLRSIEA